MTTEELRELSEIVERGSELQLALCRLREMRTKLGKTETLRFERPTKVIFHSEYLDRGEQKLCGGYREMLGDEFVEDVWAAIDALIEHRITAAEASLAELRVSVGE